MEGVGVVVIVGLVDAVLKPAAAAVHGLQLVEVRGDHGPVGAVGEVLLPEKLENVHRHEQVVVVDDAAAAAGGKPAADLRLFVRRERCPQVAGGELECDGHQAHLDMVLMV